MVTFHRIKTYSEFCEEWRVDIGDDTFEWVESLDDLVEWLYEEDYPRQLFIDHTAVLYRPISDLELALRNQINSARKIRQWVKRNS